MKEWPRRRRWLLWGAMALLGAVAGAFLVRWRLRNEGVPERMRSDERAKQASPPSLDDEYRSENLRVQFRRPEKAADEEEVAPPSRDGEAAY